MAAKKQNLVKNLSDLEKSFLYVLFSSVNKVEEEEENLEDSLNKAKRHFLTQEYNNFKFYTRNPMSKSDLQLKLLGLFTSRIGHTIQNTPFRGNANGDNCINNLFYGIILEFALDNCDSPATTLTKVKDWIAEKTDKELIDLSIRIKQ